MSKNNLILLIEDDHDIRVTLRQTLEMASYDVLSAPNGADGLNILNKQRPDLIILDMIMPLMDGEEFLQAKLRDDRLRNIPVILISAYDDKLKLAPEIPKFKKPFDMNQFLEKIPLILENKMKHA